MSGHLFVFVGRDRKKIKILYWDRTGFALWHKRLERRKFPAPAELVQRSLSIGELHAYPEGIEIPTMRPYATMRSAHHDFINLHHLMVTVHGTKLGTPLTESG